MSNKIGVKNTKKYGKGVFAKVQIEKNELLMIFGGYVLTRNEEEKLPKLIRDIAIQIGPDFVIGIKNKKDLSDADYVNHSCNANCGIKGQISLFSIKKIEVGEQITFDYGTVLYREKNAPLYKLECFCGANNCRKIITQDDWKDTDFQNKHRGFLPYYIQDNIK